MDDAALIGIHRLERLISLLGDDLVGDLPCKLGQRGLALCAVVVGIKHNADEAALVIVVEQADEVLQRVKSLAAAADDDAEAVAGKPDAEAALDLLDLKLVFAAVHLFDNTLEVVNGAVYKLVVELDLLCGSLFPLAFVLGLFVSLVSALFGSGLLSRLFGAGSALGRLAFARLVGLNRLLNGRGSGLFGLFRQVAPAVVVESSDLGGLAAEQAEDLLFGQVDYFKFDVCILGRAELGDRESAGLVDG